MFEAESGEGFVMDDEQKLMEELCSLLARTPLLQRLTAEQLVRDAQAGHGMSRLQAIRFALQTVTDELANVGKESKNP